MLEAVKTVIKIWLADGISDGEVQWILIVQLKALVVVERQALFRQGYAGASYRVECVMNSQQSAVK